MNKSTTHPSPVTLPALLAVALFYALTSWAVRRIFGEATIFFLASGIALAAVLIGGQRYAASVFLGALLANIVLAEGWHWSAAAMALGSPLAAWLGARLIQRDSDFDNGLVSLHNLLRLFLSGALVGTAVSAAVGASSLLLAGFVNGEYYILTLFNWWMGDALGVLLIAPLILLWWPAHGRQRPTPAQLAELGMILLCTLLLGGINFLDWGQGNLHASTAGWLKLLAHGHWMFLLLPWAALRVGERGTSLVLLLIAALGVMGVYQGTGIHAHADLQVRLLNYWIYTAILTLVGMALAICIDAGKRQTQTLSLREAALNHELKGVLAALDEHAIVATTDVQGRILSVNDKFCQISGYSRDELIGQDHQMLNSGTHPTGFFKAMYRTIATGATWGAEVCNRAKDAHLYWVRTTVSPLTGVDGKPSMYIAIRADITGRKQSEIKLAEREQIYRSIVTQASDGISLIDPETQHFVEFNNALCDGLGYSREEFALLRVADIQGDFDEAATAEHLRATVADGQASFDTLHRHKNGSLRNVHVNRRLITIAERQYIVSVVSDNTERIQAHQAEVDAREFLQQIVAQVPGCLYQFKLAADGRFSAPYASDGLRELYGLAPEDVRLDATGIFAPIHPDDQAAFTESIMQSARAFTPWRHEYRLLLPSGALRWIAGNAVPQRGEQGSVLWHGFITDITERKTADAELTRYQNHLEELVAQKTAEVQASQERFQLAVEGAEEGIWDWNLATSELYHSARMWEMLGYSAGELPNERQAWDAITNPEDIVTFKAEMVKHFKDPAHEFEVVVRLRARNGDWRWILSRGKAGRDKNGRATRFTGTHTDITDRRQSEEAAHAANRSKSEFLANMSHEIRTPMNGVIGMVDILQQTALAPAQARMLDTIHNSSLALLSILNDILDFSKIEAGKLEVESIPTHLREVVEGVAQLMFNVAGSKDAQISLFVDPALPTWVMSDPTRLRQVLFNLLGNALKFIPQRIGRAMLHVHPMVRPDGVAVVQFSIIDNGIGMSKAVVDKLFQPFTQADASTARKFGGTGLGLSITQRLVELMHGRITVTSTLGVGSEFMVEFPLHAASAPLGRTVLAEPDLTGLTVLAVTPEPACMTTFQLYLGAAGARVTVVPDLATAGRQLAQMPAGTVLVFDLEDQIGPLAEMPQFQPWPSSLAVVRLINRNAHSDVMPPAHTNEIRVLARPLLYHDLLHGVAVAGGRARAADLSDAAQPAHTATRKTLDVESAAQAGRLILVAEDNETNRDVMKEQLRLLGYTAEMAEDGALALQMWQTAAGRYALLLTDCHMPNKDGFELTEAIRQSEPVGTHLPIIAITANAMQGEAQRCRERGMDDYLSKPLRLTELGPMLTKWLPQLTESASALSAEQSPPRLQGAVDALPIWNPATLADLVGDNPALHQRLLSKFLLNAKIQVEAVLTGAAAGDLDAAANAAHTLKSAARSVGALALGELCDDIETAGRAADSVTCLAGVALLSATFARATQAIEAALAAPQPEANQPFGALA